MIAYIPSATAPRAASDTPAASAERPATIFGRLALALRAAATPLRAPRRATRARAGVRVTVERAATPARPLDRLPVFHPPGVVRLPGLVEEAVLRGAHGAR